MHVCVFMYECVCAVYLCNLHKCECKHLSNSPKKDLEIHYGCRGWPPATPSAQPEAKPKRQAVVAAGELVAISHLQP